MKVCGIYKITSPTGRIYIGQSIDIYQRWKRYKQLGCKEQQRLYNSIKKHGFENHTTEIICECERQELNDKEKYYVDLYQSFNTKHGLNLMDGGGSKASVSDETKQKMREASAKRNYGKGRIVSDDTKRKISESHKNIPTKIAGWNKGLKGVFSHTEEYKKMMSEKRKGIVFSDETRLKMSIAKKGKPQTNSMKGFKHSEETKAKMRASREKYLNNIVV